MKIALVSDIHANLEALERQSKKYAIVPTLWVI